MKVGEEEYSLFRDHEYVPRHGFKGVEISMLTFTGYWRRSTSKWKVYRSYFCTTPVCAVR